MPTTDVKQIKTGESRAFVQVNGASPFNQYAYYGQLTLGEIQKDSGSSEASLLPSSERTNTWEIVDMIPGSPSLGSTDFTHRMDRFLRDPWIDLEGRNCLFNMQVKNGKCQRPDSIQDWESKWLLIDCRMTSLTTPMVNPLSGDDNAEGNLAGSIEFRRRLPIRRMTLSEYADTAVVAEVLDVFFNDPTNNACDDCGETGQGIYALTVTNSGSPGLSGQLVFSTNAGQSWTTIDIVPLGGTSPNRFAPVGAYVVIAAEGKTGHIYGALSDVDNGTSNFTLVTTSYVASKGPRAVYSKNPALTFLAAAGGYVYALDNPTSAPTVLHAGTLTVQNLNDIHGSGDTIVAVGASNAVIYSDNNGDTFASVTGPAVGVNLTGVWCLTDYLWAVTTGTGLLYFTINKGRTWTQKLLPGGLTTINDIRFGDDDQLGYIAGQTLTTAKMLTTTDGGNTWQLSSTSDNRLQGVPTADRLNAIAVLDANKIALGGRKTIGGDGTLLIGS